MKTTAYKDQSGSAQATQESYTEERMQATLTTSGTHTNSAEESMFIICAPFLWYKTLKPLNIYRKRHDHVVGNFFRIQTPTACRKRLLAYSTPRK